MSTHLPLLGELPSNWQTAEFGEVLLGGTRNGIYKPKKDHGAGTKIVNMGELFANPRLRDVPMRRLQLTESELSRFSLRTGDLLFARRSLVNEGAGKCSVIMELGETTVFESSIIRARPNPEVMDSLFLFYLFSSSFGQYSLGSIRREMAVAGITGADLQKLRIPVPPIGKQRHIARILSTLDDKIELNRRMNRTLEAIARAIFKSWFIDFDPVYAKAEGREPVGMDSKTAALFPDSFEDSPLGKIPKGWETTKLSDIAQVNARSIGKEYPHAEIAYVDISSVDEGVLSEPTRYRLTEAPSRARRVVQDGDTIWSCVRPNRKAFLYIHRPPDDLVVSTGFAVLTPTETPPSYLYHWTTTKSFVDYLAALAHGAAYPAVRAGTFEEAAVLLPSSEILSAFEEVAAPIRRLISEQQDAAHSLGRIRDALLPRLLSGGTRLAAIEDGDTNE